MNLLCHKCELEEEPRISQYKEQLPAIREGQKRAVTKQKR